MVGGTPFSCLVLEVQEKDAVFVTVRGNMTTRDAERLYELIEPYLDKRKPRYVFLLAALKHSSDRFPGQLVNLAGQMSRVRGLVILDSPEPAIIAQLVRMSGRHLDTLFSVTHNDEQIQQVLDEHQRAKMGTVQVTEL